MKTPSMILPSFSSFSLNPRLKTATLKITISYLVEFYLILFQNYCHKKSSQAPCLFSFFLIVATTHFPYHLLSKLLVDVINNAVELLARAKGQQVSRPALTNIQGLKQFSIRCYPSYDGNDFNQLVFLAEAQLLMAVKN